MIRTTTLVAIVAITAGLCLGSAFTAGAYLQQRSDAAQENRDRLARAEPTLPGMYRWCTWRPLARAE